MSATWSGALQPKKKEELQEIAAALDLDSNGTKYDILERIKTHLAAYQQHSQDPRFAGLYSKRKPSTRAVKESSQQPADYSGSEEPSAGPVTRRGAGKPIFPTSSPAEPKQIEEAPVSRPSSPVRSVIEFVNKQVAKAPEPEAVVQLVEQRSKQLYSEADRALTGARWYLSNSKNIASLTVLAELAFIIYFAVPWQYYQVPLNAPWTTHHDGPTPAVSDKPLVSTRVAHIPYPPSEFLKSHWPYTTLLLWSIPTIVIPQLVGTLVSFKPGSSWSDAPEADPLTAAIIRIACVLAGDWNLDWATVGVTHKWRLLSASVAAAFAFAEAIGERKPAPAKVLPQIEDAEEEEEEDSQSIVLRRRSTRRG